MCTGTLAGCRHQDSNLGRTNHTALSRVHLATLVWRHSQFHGQDSILRIPSVRVVSLQLLATWLPGSGDGLIRTAIPCSGGRCRAIGPHPPATAGDWLGSSSHAVRRRVKLRSLSALGFKPSAVAYPHVSPRRVPESNREPVAGAGIAGQWGHHSPDTAYRADEDSNLGSVHSRHRSSSVGLSALGTAERSAVIIYLYDWFELRNHDCSAVVAGSFCGASFGSSREYHTGPCRLQTLLGPSPPERFGLTEPTEFAYLDEYPHVGTPRATPTPGFEPGSRPRQGRMLAGLHHVGRW